MFEFKDPTVRVGVDLTARRIALESLRQRDDFVEAFALTGYRTVCLRRSNSLLLSIELSPAFTL